MTASSGWPSAPSPADKPAIIYLPEGMQPLVQSLTAVKGEIAPAPALPRWLAYGDWTTQGWIASGPSQGWAAIAARKAGLNLVNMGYAGAGRGEIVSAEHIAALTAEIVTIAYGESCWTRIPHSLGMVGEGFKASSTWSARDTRTPRSWSSARCSDPTPRTCPTSSAPRWPTSVMPSSR